MIMKVIAPSSHSIGMKNNNLHYLYLGNSNINNKQKHLSSLTCVATAEPLPLEMLLCSFPVQTTKINLMSLVCPGTETPQWSCDNGRELKQRH